MASRPRVFSKKYDRALTSSKCAAAPVATNLSRLQSLVSSTPAGKYVVVNIPAAQIEAITIIRLFPVMLACRKPDRPSPVSNPRSEEITSIRSGLSLPRF